MWYWSWLTPAPGIPYPENMYFYLCFHSNLHQILFKKIWGTLELYFQGKSANFKILHVTSFQSASGGRADPVRRVELKPDLPHSMDVALVACATPMTVSQPKYNAGGYFCFQNTIYCQTIPITRLTPEAKFSLGPWALGMALEVRGPLQLLDLIGHGLSARKKKLWLRSIPNSWYISNPCTAPIDLFRSWS